MANITARKNKNGEITSYRIRVFTGRDIDGKQKMKTLSWTPPEGMTQFQINKEIKAIAADFEKKCNNETSIDDNITFKELTDIWIKDYAETNLKKTTFLSYKQQLIYVNKEIGHLKINKINPITLSSLYAKMLKKKVTVNMTCSPVIDFQNYIYTYNRDKGRKIVTDNSSLMTQSELSRKSGVSLATIKSILKGNNITIECAKKICDALKLNYKKSFSETEKKTMEASTVKRYHAMISSIMSFAVYQGVIDSNPCSRVRPPKVEKKEAEYLEEDEMVNLMDALDKYAPEHYKTLIPFLLFTGLKRGEMSGLEWRDIDFDNNIVHIRRNVIYMKETGIYEDTPKNKYSNRKIKVSDYVMQMLMKYREWQDYQRENVGSKLIESGKVFTGVTGKPLHPSTPSKWFRSFNLKYGLKPIHLHTLRHTSATMMIMNGIPLNEISKRLGHNCASTTSNIYCHVIEEADQKAAEALDNAILSKLKRA